MLLVKTKILASEINGIGLFADQFIEKGTIIFQEDEYTITVQQNEFENLPEIQKQFFEHYGYKQSGVYKCSIDDDRFMNHSNCPNTDDGFYPDKTIAARDIERGEEITCDYRVIKMKFQP